MISRPPSVYCIGGSQLKVAAPVVVGGGAGGGGVVGGAAVPVAAAVVLSPSPPPHALSRKQATSADAKNRIPV